MIDPFKISLDIRDRGGRPARQVPEGVQALVWQVAKPIA